MTLLRYNTGVILLVSLVLFQHKPLAVILVN